MFNFCMYSEAIFLPRLVRKVVFMLGSLIVQCFLLFSFDPFYARRNFRNAFTYALVDIVFEGGTMFYAGSITLKS